MIDILYLAHNRLEFTKASVAALIDNTEWNLVKRLFIYDDNSQDGTREYLTGLQYPILTEFVYGSFGHPVTVMNHFFREKARSTIFAKIDSDTMVPPHWLSECLNVIEAQPELDLLGIEAFRPVVAEPTVRTYDDARFIGGIGLMRMRAFSESRPAAAGTRFGFTEWQELRKAQHQLQPGWLNPALPVFLLDRIPREPWRSLSLEYIAKGWQRDWGPYGEESKVLWSWWCD